MTAALGIYDPLCPDDPFQRAQRSAQKGAAAGPTGAAGNAPDPGSVRTWRLWQEELSPGAYGAMVPSVRPGSEELRTGTRGECVFGYAWFHGVDEKDVRIAEIPDPEASPVAVNTDLDIC